MSELGGYVIEARRRSHGGARTIDPCDFEFVSRNSRIAAAREFLAKLPSLLSEPVSHPF